MPVVDIAWWVRRLLEYEPYGWSQNEILLAKYLGFHHKHGMRKALYRGTMQAKLQRRVAANLQNILDGHVVCERRPYRAGALLRIVASVVHVTPPRPITERGPAHALVSVTPTGVKLTLKPRLGQAHATAVMPSFQDIWRGLS